MAILAFVPFGDARPEKPNLLAALNQEICTIVDKVYPSMVVVEADFPVKGLDGSTFTATGTGIIITKKYIVTSASLVEGKVSIWIIDDKKDKIEAKLAGIDRLRGLAILETVNHNLTPIKTGDVGQLKPGNYLVIVGNSVDVLMASTVGTFNGFDECEGKLKILVNLSPGFSGGAVVNTSGELVGILSGKNPEFISLGMSSLSDIGRIPFSSGKTSLASGSVPEEYRMSLPATNAVSARPINEILTAVKQIEKDGKISYGFLGISQREARRQVPNVYSTKLIRVTNVSDDSPAQKAGIMTNDYIILYDGKDITGANQLYYMVKTTPPGEKVDITLMRNDSLRTISVELGEIEEKYIVANPGISFPSTGFFPGDLIGTPDVSNIKSGDFRNEQRSEMQVRIEQLNAQVRQLQDEIKHLSKEVKSGKDK